MSRLAAKIKDLIALIIAASLSVVLLLIVYYVSSNFLAFLTTVSPNILFLGIVFLWGCGILAARK